MYVHHQSCLVHHQSPTVCGLMRLETIRYMTGHVHTSPVTNPLRPHESRNRLIHDRSCTYITSHRPFVASCVSKPSIHDRSSTYITSHRPFADSCVSKPLDT